VDAGAERDDLVGRSLGGDRGPVGEPDAIDHVVAEEGAVDHLAAGVADLEADELGADEDVDAAVGAGHGEVA
jgi:hypothetical protein